MKVQIDVVTGFLGSGKTTFINGLLHSDRLAEERIVVIQCETGEVSIDEEGLQEERVHREQVKKEEDINAVFIKKILREYLPHRIIIEHNGMSRVEGLLEALEDRRLSKTCSIATVVHVLDASTFGVFMNNMGSVLVEQISNSDVVILNRTEGLPGNKVSSVRKSLAAIRRSARLLSIASPEECRLAVDSGAIYEEEKEGFLSKPSDRLFLLFVMLVTAYFLYAVGGAIKQANVDLSGLLSYNTIFLSILIQAFPFILMGTFISSILQVFISEETIARLFPRNGIVAFGAAILSGVLFPVCDCAIVPVVGRLVRKGVPLPVAITFMLAAPIVNPVVIASTFYAFPGQISVVVLRTLLGTAVAITVGLMLILFPEKNALLLHGISQYTCKCGFCGREYKNRNGFIAKIDAVFMHTAAEFFDVGRFMVMGAFISTTLLTVMPKDVLANISGDNTLALLAMMAAAFIFSICSTSDAFIARTFSSQFALGPVMGFLVLGPMFDIKNLLMLFGSFTKRFVVKLVVVIFAVSFALLYFGTTLLF